MYQDEEDFEVEDIRNEINEFKLDMRNEYSVESKEIENKQNVIKEKKNHDMKQKNCCGVRLTDNFFQYHCV